MKEYYKLVRDKIPELIDKSGGTPICYNVSLYMDLKRVFIKQKILEETLELVKADEDENIVEELADLLEVIEAYINVFEISFEDISSTKGRKKKEKGGFDNFIVLEKVE